MDVLPYKSKPIVTATTNKISMAPLKVLDALDSENPQEAHPPNKTKAARTVWASATGDSPSTTHLSQVFGLNKRGPV